MSDRTIAKRQAELRERRRREGLVRVEVYVHHTRKEEIRKIAKQLEAPAAAKNPAPKRSGFLRGKIKADVDLESRLEFDEREKKQWDR